MHCTHCGLAMGAGTRFCPNCGKEQTATAAAATSPAATMATGDTSPSMAGPPGAVVSGNGKGGLIAVVVAVAALGLGGAGYWAYERNQAAEEAAAKVAAMEQQQALMRRQNAQATATAQTAAAEAARAAEETERLAVAVAHAALDKAIAQEEEQAKVRLASTTR